MTEAFENHQDDFYNRSDINWSELNGMIADEIAPVIPKRKQRLKSFS